MMALFRNRVFPVVVAVILSFTCFLMFLIPRVEATMVYDPYDIMTYWVVISGSTAEASGSQYGYYYNGSYNTSSTTISGEMYASYSDLYNSQLAAFWQYNQSSYGPHVGNDGYLTYLDYIDACMQEAVTNSSNNSYMSFGYNAENILEAHYAINPMTADLMFEFFKWQNSLLLGGTNIDSTDFNQSAGNIGYGVSTNQDLYVYNYPQYSRFTYGSAKSQINITSFSGSSPLYAYCTRTYNSSTGKYSFNLTFFSMNGGTVYYLNTSGTATSFYLRSNNSGVYTYSLVSGESTPTVNGFIPQYSTEPPTSSTVIYDLNIQFTSKDGVQQMTFDWLQNYLDAVDASLEPGYDGAAPQPPLISYDLSGTGISSTSTDTETSEAVAEGLMQNNGGDGVRIDTMYDEPENPGEEDDGEIEEVSTIPHLFAIPLFNWPSLSGIWYYVVRWVQSMASWMSTMFGLWGLLPPAMVYPVWGTAVVVIVVGLYRRFFM